jgi:FAD dependent oxidoreductase TIGR03364
MSSAGPPPPARDRRDMIVVGAGIMGLAFAWEAARRGRRVTVLERSPAARGASIRNFGMVWPIGQPAGPRHTVALASRSRWLELRDAGAVWARECGSVHAVRESDEAAVLAEFADRAPAVGIACELLPGPEAVRRFPALDRGIRAALWSPSEVVVDPPRALPAIAGFLAARHGVEFRFGTTVVDVDMPRVRTAAGDALTADVVIVCGGADFETLFPGLWRASGGRRCRLQMLKTASQPDGWRLGPHVAGGLTLAHYPGFEICPSLPAVKARFAAERPEHAAAGIHVMATQNEAGEVILGDSHDEADVESPFGSERIDDLILDYAQKMLRLPDWRIAARWQGVYAKPAAGTHFTAEPQPECHVMGSPGGAGMTLSFGIAAAWWREREAATVTPLPSRAGTPCG